MEEIKDYIFYTILKDFSKNRWKETGFSYGVKKGKSVDHIEYFRAFLDIDYFPWEFLKLSPHWPISLEIMAADGNIMIANSSPETDDFKQRTYLLYLPENPTLFQILFLEKVSEELTNTTIEIGIFGKKTKEEINKKLIKSTIAHPFLNSYITFHKKQLEKTKPNPQKTL